MSNILIPCSCYSYWKKPCSTLPHKKQIYQVWLSEWDIYEPQFHFFLGKDDLSVGNTLQADGPFSGQEAPLASTAKSMCQRLVVGKGLPICCLMLWL